MSPNPGRGGQDAHLAPERGARYRWRLAPPPPEESNDLARAVDVPPLVGRLLWNRGLRWVEAARSFLRASLEDLHDPFLMKDMDRAADRLARALTGGERVIVYGDYDADGLCATALMVHFFRALGPGGGHSPRVETYIPDRLQEGYGLNMEAIRSLGREATDLKEAKGLLLTVDTGITNLAEVEAARSAGLDVIVTDHHQPLEQLPRAFAVLSPHQPGCPYPDKTLCGTGIAFKLLIALRRRLRDLGWAGPLPNLKRSLDLVALATVADVAGVQGENRSLLRHGLRELAASARPGLQALLRVAGTRPQLEVCDLKTLTYGQVAFQLAPRLNAAGRLGDAKLGLELLLESDPARAAGLAGRLDEVNRERQALQEEVLREARSRVLAGPSPRGGHRPQDGPIVLADPAWHVGVLGIVASKLVEEFRRPAVLIQLDGEVGKGSGRSAGGLHLQKALAECADLLERFGGHKEAAGLTLRAERLGEFTERFARVVRERVSFEDCAPVLDVDARVGLSDLTPDLVAALEGLAPFGPGNERPVFCAEGLRVAGSVRTVGKDGRHLKVELYDPAGGCSMEAIGFGMGKEERLEVCDLWSSSTGPTPVIDAAFEAEINRWNGRAAVQLVLRDVRRSETDGP